jgi:hypothetical protein
VGGRQRLSRDSIVHGPAIIVKWSPIAPITVSSSPQMTWARAPTPLTRTTTASTSSCVADGFITIIIWLLVLSTRRGM